MENLALFSNEKRKNIYFSNINLFFGYSGSGKTTLLDDLSSIFNGKNKNYLMNGIPIHSNDFNIIKVSSFEDLSSHLKMSTKSLLKKYFHEIIYSEQFITESNSILSSIKALATEMSSSIQDILPDSELEFSYDNLIDVILDLSTIVTKEDSHSYYKRSLLKLVDDLSKLTSKKTLILMDDYDSSLDEDALIDLFDIMTKSNAYYFLTSSKPLPQQFISEYITIFGVRDGKLIPFPNIKDLISSCLESQPTYKSFEEYMLSKGFIETSGIVDMYIRKLKEDQCANLMRILTAKNPIVTNTPSPGKVCIIPKSKEEEEIYNAALEILNTNKPQ